MSESRSWAIRVWDGVSSFWTPVFILLFAIGAMSVILFTPVLTGVFGTSGWVMPLEVLLVLVPALLLLWFLVNRRIGFAAKTIVVGFVGIGCVAAILAIDEVEVNGNNVVIVRWRWDPSREERLASANRLAAGDVLATKALSDEDLSGAACSAFLGPRRDGSVEVANLRLDWDSNPPVERWRFPIGGGYSAFAIQGRAAVTIEQQGDQEVITAYSTVDGEPIWRRAYLARFSETMGGDGPRATPTVVGDLVYVLGATGVLSCLEIRTGTLRWSREILRDAAAENAIWGMSGSPLVVDNLVIVNPGGEDGRGLIAYDRMCGDIVWTAGDHKAAYSSPTLATIAGVRQVLILDFDGLAGHDLKSGKELWRYAFSVLNGISVANPLVLPNNRVFVSASYGGGCTMVQVEEVDGEWSAKELWHSPTAMRCKFTSPVLIDKYIYGLNDGVLVCLDPETGKQKWKRGRYGHGQILHAGRWIFVQCENGEFAVVEANPDAYREIASIRVLPGEKNWNAPAIAGDLLLVRNHFEMAAFDLPFEQDAEAISSQSP